MMDIYDFFSENFNKATSNSTIDEYVMHHIHQTDSQIYDYIGEENYDASYIMADIDLGPKVNVVTGVRRETNETPIIQMSPLTMHFRIGFILESLFHIKERTL